MDQLVNQLRAAAERTRLRILGLCAHGELTVSDLVEILGQSQPRVSRHLKLLLEAGLLARHQEGSWAYFRLAESGDGGLAGMLVDLMPADDPVHRLDLERMRAVRQAYATKAAAFFRRNAADWERIRALHGDQAEVDAALLRLFGPATVDSLLDIGTGTGHVLRVLAGRCRDGVGIDRSLDMLNVARATLFHDGATHCQVRQADMMALPFAAGRFDAATLHMVLHYAERPAAAIAEAARVLKPGGRLIVADFAPHQRAELRDEHAHRWLGFDPADIAGWLDAAGLQPEPAESVGGGALTVMLWPARRPDDAPAPTVDAATAADLETLLARR